MGDDVEMVELPVDPVVVLALPDPPDAEPPAWDADWQVALTVLHWGRVDGGEVVDGVPPPICNGAVVIEVSGGTTFVQVG